MHFDHHQENTIKRIPFETRNTSRLQLSNPVFPMWTRTCERVKAVRYLDSYISWPRDMSSLHSGKQTWSCRIAYMENHHKRCPSHTSSQSYLVCLGGSGLHLCKHSEVSIKFSHFKEHRRTPRPWLPFPYLAIWSAAHTWLCLLQFINGWKQTSRAEESRTASARPGQNWILAGFRS